MDSRPILLSLCDFGGAWSAPYLALGYRVIRVDPKHGGIDQGGRGLTSGVSGELSLIAMEDGGEALAMTAGAVAALLKVDPLALGGRVKGILMAPPCTDFAVSGNQWWPTKDADGRTAASISIVEECLACKDAVDPDFWVLENPVGRLPRLVPAVGRPQLYFDPCDYAGFADDPASEAYTKKTVLYGRFNTALEQSRMVPLVDTTTSVQFEADRELAPTVKQTSGSPMFMRLGGKSERTKELRSKTPTGFSRAFASANH